ncbi:hypothetical protein HDV05_006233, partial [Chytridiales sp. JEL 0842]
SPLRRQHRLSVVSPAQSVASDHAHLETPPVVGFGGASAVPAMSLASPSPNSLGIISPMRPAFSQPSTFITPVAPVPLPSETASDYSPTLPSDPSPAYIPTPPSQHPDTPYYYVLPPGSTIWTAQGWTQTTVPLYYPANAPLPTHVYPNTAVGGPMYVPMQQGAGYGGYYPQFGAVVGSGGYYGVPPEVPAVGMDAVPESPSVSEGDATVGVVSPAHVVVDPTAESENSGKEETVEQSPLEKGGETENGDEEDAEGCLSRASSVTVTAGNCGSSSSINLTKGLQIDKVEVESLVDGLKKLEVENQREAGVVA